MTSPSMPPLESAPPRIRHLILGAAGGMTVAGVVGIALSPWLLVEHPGWLIVLSPEFRHVALTADALGLPTLLLLGVARRVLGLLAAYGIGGIYGEALLRWTERRYARLARVVRWVERLFLRWGPPLFVIFPSYGMATLAGAAGTRLRSFVPWVAVGQAVWIAAWWLFGDSIKDFTAILLHWLGDHVIESTAATVILVAVQQAWSRLRGSSGLPDLGADESPPE